MRIKEPESPGSVIPETPIIPQIKTNQRLSFTPAGFKKLIPKPTEIPIKRDITFTLFHSPKPLPI